MKNEIAAKKKKKNGNWLKVAPSLKKEKKELKKKDRHWERQEIFKVIPRKECGTDTSG